MANDATVAYLEELLEAATKQVSEMEVSRNHWQKFHDEAYGRLAIKINVLESELVEAKKGNLTSATRIEALEADVERLTEARDDFKCERDRYIARCAVLENRCRRIGVIAEGRDDDKQ